MSTPQVKSLTPHAAWEFLQAHPNAVLIDVRSNMEFLFVGHPPGAVHIAWIDEPDWTINPDFAREVRKTMLGGLSTGSERECAAVVLICRSGKRSLEAGKKLVEEGISDVYNIDEGFEGELDETHHRSSAGGWRFHGLPWEQC